MPGRPTFSYVVEKSYLSNASPSVMFAANAHRVMRDTSGTSSSAVIRSRMGRRRRGLLPGASSRGVVRDIEITTSSRGRAAPPACARRGGPCVRGAGSGAGLVQGRAGDQAAQPTGDHRDGLGVPAQGLVPRGVLADVGVHRVV